MVRHLPHGHMPDWTTLASTSTSWIDHPVGLFMHDPNLPIGQPHVRRIPMHQDGCNNRSHQLNQQKLIIENGFANSTFQSDNEVASTERKWSLPHNYWDFLFVNISIAFRVWLSGFTTHCLHNFGHFSFSCRVHTKGVMQQHAS